MILVACNEDNLCLLQDATLARPSTRSEEVAALILRADALSSTGTAALARNSDVAVPSDLC